MTVDLKKITRGKVAMKPRICWYSADGIGKTSAAAGAPKPFFLDMNRGSLKFDVERVTPGSFEELMEWLRAIELGQVPCETVVLDSLSEIEAMFSQKYFGDEGITAWNGGYGRGDDRAYMKFLDVINQIERVWLMGKGIIFTAHAKIAKFEDPSGPAYNRFELALRPQIAGLVRQWCDFVLFAREEVLLSREKNERTKGKTTGIRYQYTRRCPAFDAKARGTTLFPEALPLGWQPLWEAIQADDSRSAKLRTELDAMLAAIGDPAVTEKCISWLRESPMYLVEAHNRAKELLEKKKSAEESPTTDTSTAAPAAA
jgi:hypothetical protein